MNPWINYHHLLYFKTIAEESSVSKAAEKLRLGQPALSAQLKQFEDAIGVTLFERQHKKLILTEQGKLALQYAQSIFKLGNEMFEALHDRLTPSRVHLQIGALDSIPKQVILDLTKEAYKFGPCNVSLIEGKLDELIRELTSHRIDLLVTNHLPTSAEIRGLSYRSVVKRPVYVYGAPHFKRHRKGFPQSISGEKFVLPTYDSKLRHDVDHWARLHIVNMDIVAETQDISLKKLMATEGLGLITVASHTVMRQVANGELIQIGSLYGVSEELFLISVERKISNPYAAKLMKSFNIKEKSKGD